jgi:hypothetical protein
MTTRVASLQVVLVLSFCNLVAAQSTGTFTPTGNMNVPRFSHTATLLTNGKVLIAGGISAPGKFLSSAELYDPATGAFTPTGDMTWPQSGHSATLLPDGKVLIVGGIGVSGVSNVTADLYDPGTGTFHPAGLIQSDASLCPSTALLNNGKVLIVLGAWYPGPKGMGSPALLYDPVEQQFATAAVSTIDIVEDEACPTATLLADGKVLVTWQNPAAELYQPDTNSFVPAGTMIVHPEYWSYTAILLTTSNVLIAGGGDDWDNTSAELYDPSVPTFRSTGFLKQAICCPTATLLPDGKVLMAGGNYDYPPFISNTAEIYDSGDGTFSSAGEMVTARGSHTATLLMDGTVLLAGGYYNDNPLTPNSIAELYVPPVLSPIPVAKTFLFDRSVVAPGSSYSVNIAGSNLSAQSIIDERIMRPERKKSGVLFN